MGTFDCFFVFSVFPLSFEFVGDLLPGSAMNSSDGGANMYQTSQLANAMMTTADTAREWSIRGEFVEGGEAVWGMLGEKVAEANRKYERFYVREPSLGVWRIVSNCIGPARNKVVRAAVTFTLVVIDHDQRMDP